MNIVSACLIAMTVAGCASKPAEPAWRANAASSLDSFSDTYLKGDSAIAATELARARAEMARTGRPDMLAHAELVACATRVASLEYDNCPQFAALAQDATPAERAYAAYLAGRWQGLDLALLPEQHRAVASGAGKLGEIGDPLARLVAAGVLFETGRLAPADITVALDTASNQGWRRPLLMWLGVAAKRARAAGDAAEVERLERRIALASSR